MPYTKNFLTILVVCAVSFPCPRILSDCYTVPSLAHILGGLRTTSEDEYAFWNVTPTRVASAVPPFALTFSTTLRGGHALLAADEEGILTILDTTRSLKEQMHADLPSTSPLARFRAHDNAIFDATFLRQDTAAATASGDGTVRVFDLETTFRCAMLRASRGSVKCVRVQPGNGNVIAAASRDGTIRLFDVRASSRYDTRWGREDSQKAVLTVERAHEGSIAEQVPATRKRRRVAAKPSASVTSLAWGSNHEIFSGGAADGAVKLWDLRTNGKTGCMESVVPGLEGSRQRGYGIANMDLVDGKLAVSCTDSTIYVYNANGMRLGHTHMLEGHTQTSFYIRARLSPCGGFVMSGSADSMAYIWDLAGRTERGVLAPILRLEGHRGGDASCVAWCRAEEFKIATCGDDTTLKVWKVKRGEQAAEPGPWEGPWLNGARKVEPTVKKREERIVKVGSKRTLRNTDIRSFFSSTEPAGAVA